jgi:hypothetical protein
VVSFVIIFLTFNPPAVSLILEDYSRWGLFLSKGAGIFAGVYVMVRAFDNIEQGLPARFRTPWDCWFYGKSL